MLTPATGCYECSQRRIDCDRTEPSCNKCSSRGLSCSGFGVKYRFRNGFVPGRRTPKRSRSSNSYASTTLQASPASTSDSDHSWSTRSGISDGHTSRGSILTDGSYGCFHLGMSESPAPPGGCASGVNISHQGSQNGTAPLNDRSDLVFEAIEQDPLLGFVHGDEPCDAFFAHGGSGYEASPECNSQGVFDVIAEYTSLLGSEEAESQALSSDESSLSYDECMAESPITPNSDWCEDIAPGCQVDLVDSSSKRLLLKHCESPFAFTIRAG